MKKYKVLVKTTFYKWVETTANKKAEALDKVAGDPDSYILDTDDFETSIVKAVLEK